MGGGNSKQKEALKGKKEEQKRDALPENQQQISEVTQAYLSLHSARMRAGNTKQKQVLKQDEKKKREAPEQQQIVGSLIQAGSSDDGDLSVGTDGHGDFMAYEAREGQAIQHGALDPPDVRACTSLSEPQEQAVASSGGEPRNRIENDVHPAHPARVATSVTASPIDQLLPRTKDYCQQVKAAIQMIAATIAFNSITAEDSYSAFDTDDDGKISLEDLQTAMQTLFPGIQDDIAKAMFDALEQQGYISSGVWADAIYAADASSVLVDCSSSVNSENAATAAHLHLMLKAQTETEAAVANKQIEFATEFATADPPCLIQVIQQFPQTQLDSADFPSSAIQAQQLPFLPPEHAEGKICSDKEAATALHKQVDITELGRNAAQQHIPMTARDEKAQEELIEQEFGETGNRAPEAHIRSKSASEGEDENYETALLQVKSSRLESSAAQQHAEKVTDQPHFTFSVQNNQELKLLHQEEEFLHLEQSAQFRTISSPPEIINQDVANKCVDDEAMVLEELSIVNEYAKTALEVARDSIARIVQGDFFSEVASTSSTNISNADTGDNSRTEDPAQMSFTKFAGMSIKLALSFSAAGQFGTPSRVAFEKELAKDLANASGVLMPSSFLIKNVCPGSVIADVELQSTHEGPDPHDVARELEAQATDARSPLRAGIITRFTESITLIPVPMVSTVGKSLGVSSSETQLSPTRIFKVGGPITAILPEPAQEGLFIFQTLAPSDNNLAIEGPGNNDRGQMTKDISENYARNHPEQVLHQEQGFLQQVQDTTHQRTSSASSCPDGSSQHVLAKMSIDAQAMLAKMSIDVTDEVIKESQDMLEKMSIDAQSIDAQSAEDQNTFQEGTKSTAEPSTHKIRPSLVPLPKSSRSTKKTNTTHKTSNTDAVSALNSALDANHAKEARHNMPANVYSANEKSSETELALLRKEEPPEPVLSRQLLQEYGLEDESDLLANNGIRREGDLRFVTDEVIQELPLSTLSKAKLKELAKAFRKEHETLIQRVQILEAALQAVPLSLNLVSDFTSAHGAQAHLGGKFSVESASLPY
jgi:hypothetical protein